MLFDDISHEIRNLEKQKFTGHLKFGIENGEIVSESITTKIDLNNTSKIDVEKEIRNFYPVENQAWGIVEYNFRFGTIINSDFTINLQGEKLKERKRVLSCKSVKIVVKK